jgi:hypothetical protein
MPGPAPLDQPEFPEEFIEHARRIVRGQTVEKRLWQRARMVLLLEENPDRSHVEIGRIVGLSDQSVRIWRRRWCRKEFSLEDKPRSGRPVVFYQRR